MQSTLFNNFLTHCCFSFMLFSLHWSQKHNNFNAARCVSCFFVFLDCLALSFLNTVILSRIMLHNNSVFMRIESWCSLHCPPKYEFFSNSVEWWGLHWKKCLILLMDCVLLSVCMGADRTIQPKCRNDMTAVFGEHRMVVITPFQRSSGSAYVTGHNQ